MLRKIAVIAALCVTDAVAQVRNENCVTQNGDIPFMYCAGPLLGTTLFWNYTAGAENVPFAFEAPEGAWRAVGFSSSPPDMGPMVPANAVFGCTDMELNAMTADFQLAGRAPGQQTPEGNQNLAAYEGEVINGVCTVQFTRPANIGIELQNLGNRDQTVIFAHGGNNLQIGRHTPQNRGAMAINFAMPMIQEPDMTMPPPGQQPGETMPDNVASSHSAPVTLILVVVGSIFVALL